MNAAQLPPLKLLVEEFPEALENLALLSQAADLVSSHEESDTLIVNRYERLHLALEGVISILICLQSEFALRDLEIDDRHREVK